MDDLRYMIETCNISCVNHCTANVDNNGVEDLDITSIILVISIVLGFLASGLYFITINVLHLC